MCNINQCFKPSLLLLSVFSFCNATLKAQVRWDGGGGNGQWMTAANWVGDKLPASASDVILDNSIVTGNYIVTLPSGNNAVSVKSLTILPGPGNTIELLLPAANTAIPAFTTSGPGYGLTINNGGIFRNASGATASGAPVDISDSLKINNGGRYIQSSPRSHVDVVTVLSKAAGTEQGIFEFDIPGTAGATPSASGKTYGTLQLSATAAGGVRNYSSTGSQNITIRGDFIIGSGVNYSLSFTGAFIIKRNYVQNGGMFNLASQANNTLVTIGGNLLQNSGTITETNTGLPVIELNGTTGQHILTTGNISNSVTLRIKNAAGAVLQTPVSIPYKLELLMGIITSSVNNPLILKTGCMIQYDSLSNNSFIKGPLRKEGLLSTDHFLFPVGKDNTMRWLALNNATGNFTVEFFKSNPKLINLQCATGINHISALEYWSAESDAGVPSSGKVELSFSDPNSGGVTDLAALRVAYLTNGGWNDEGNTGITGTAGSRGSVTGNIIGEFIPADKYFTLGSSTGANTLPLGAQFPGLRSGNNALAGDLQLISLSPTMATSNFIMTVKANQSQTIQVMITSMEGKVIKAVSEFVQHGTNTLSVDVSELTKGFYNVSVPGNKRSISVLRFVKL
jgi:hypothetical protein